MYCIDPVADKLVNTCKKIHECTCNTQKKVYSRYFLNHGSSN